MAVQFSIIIPTFNRGHLISKAINSVLAQTINDWELIIIDDGSTDDTESVVNQVIDHRIVYHKCKTNQGRSNARNIGLSKAQGSWVCFLDSDDWYSEYHLEAFTNAIANHPNETIFKTGVTFLNEKGEEIERSKFYTCRSNQIEFVVNNYCSVLDLCIDTELAKSMEFPAIETWEDKAFLIKIIKENNWLQVEKRTVFALEHDGRSVKSTDLDIQKLNSTLQVINDTLAMAGMNKKNIMEVQQRQLITSILKTSAPQKTINDIHSKLIISLKMSSRLKIWRSVNFGGSKINDQP